VIGAREVDIFRYALSSVAEVVGVLITVFDLLGASGRRKGFLTNQPPLQLTTSGRMRTSGSAALTGGAPPSQEDLAERASRRA
jgi:hypothetical protein